MSNVAIPVDDAAPPQVVKLPVLATVQRAYAALFDRFGVAFRIAWFWSLVVVALQAASTLLLPTWMTNPSEIMVLDRNGLLFVSFAGFLNGLLILPALASIAVNWHRALLLGEPLAPLAFVRLDGRVWAYFGVAGIIAAIRFIASTPQILLSLDRTAAPELIIFRLLAAVLVLASLVLVPRLSLGLPGTAIGAPNTGLVMAYCTGRGNTWRLAWGSLLCLLPAILLGFVGFAIWPGADVMLGNSPLALAIRAAVTLTWPVTCLLYAGFLSYAFAHLHGLCVPIKAHVQDR